MATVGSYPVTNAGASRDHITAHAVEVPKYGCVQCKCTLCCTETTRRTGFKIVVPMAARPARSPSSDAVKTKVVRADSDLDKGIAAVHDPFVDAVLAAVSRMEVDHAILMIMQQEVAMFTRFPTVCTK